MQTTLMLLLIAVLVASVVSFAIMGLAQRRRTRTLGRKANEMGMRFSADDPFDSPRRYAGFALVGRGHSPRASNVTYGRLDGRRVCAFDFRCELGHGTRRVTRYYGVIVADMEVQVPPVLMWHAEDAESIPLAARNSEGHAACWRVVGSKSLASVLGNACEPMAGDEVSIQTHETAIMFCIPMRRRKQDYTGHLAEALTIVGKIGPSLRKLASRG